MVFSGHGVLLIAIGRVNIDAVRGKIGAVACGRFGFHEGPQATGDIVDLDDAAVCRYIAAHDLTVPVNQKTGTI